MFNFRGNCWDESSRPALADTCKRGAWVGRAFRGNRLEASQDLIGGSPWASAEMGSRGSFRPPTASWACPSSAGPRFPLRWSARSRHVVSGAPTEDSLEQAQIWSTQGNLCPKRAQMSKPSKPWSGVGPALVQANDGRTNFD